MKNNVWKKFLAGLSAAAILVTSLGVMPIVSADETTPATITETKIVEKITFDGLGESVSGEIPYDLTQSQTGARSYTFNQDGHRLDAKTAFRGQVNVSVDDPIAGAGKKFFYGGTVTANLPERETDNRYFGGASLAYKAVTFVDTDEDGTVDTRQEAVETSTSASVAFSIDVGNNPNYSNAKIDAGQQIVYEVAVQPSLGIFNVSTRPNSDYLTNADAKYVKAGLYKIFEVKNDNKLYIYDVYSESGTTKTKQIAAVALSTTKTTNDWYDLKVVYTCSEDGKHEFVTAYADGTKIYSGLMTSRVHAVSPGRVEIAGKYDDFAVTKYDGKKYSIGQTLNVVNLDFNGDVYKNAVGTQQTGVTSFGDFTTKTGGILDVIQDAEGDYSLKIVSTKTDDSNISSGKLKNNTGIDVGEQMVWSMDINTSSDAVFYPLTNQVYGSASGKRYALNPFIKIDNGKLVQYNGGADDNPSSKFNFESGTVVEEQFRLDLPSNQWINLALVYTKGETTMDVDVYVNGYLAKTETLAANYLLNGGFNRIEIAPVWFDNFKIETYRYGAEFDPNSLPKAMQETEVMPKITFDNFSTYSAEVDKSANIDNIGWSTGSPKFAVQANGAPAGTYTAELKLKPNSQTDKYFAGSYTVEADANKNMTRVINLSGGNLNQSALKTGEQIVYDFSVQSSQTLNMYTRTNGTKITGTGEGATSAQWGNECVYLYSLSDGKIWIFPGDNASTDTTKALGYVELPANQWADVKLVYTQYADKTTVFAYVNGKFAIPVKADDSGFAGENGVLTLPTVEKTYISEGVEVKATKPIMPFTENIGRFTINGHSSTALDNFAVTKYSDIKYDPAKEDGTVEPVVLNVRNTLTFDGDAYAALKGTTKEGPASGSENWNDFSIKNTSIKIVEDAEGDYSLDFAYKKSTDKANFSASGNNTGLFTGEQMQISMDIHTGSDAYITPLVYQGYNNKSAGRYYLKNLFNVKNGVLTHNNGGKDASFDGKSADVVPAFTYVLPYGQWVNLNLVYTKKASGMDVDMYVNGYLVKSEELTYNYLLNGPFDRVEFDDIHFDNVSIKTYRYGAVFDPSSLTKTEEINVDEFNYTESAGLTYAQIENVKAGSKNVGTFTRNSDEFVYTSEDDLMGMYGKSADDAAIEIVKVPNKTVEGNGNPEDEIGDYDLSTGDGKVEDGYTVSSNRRLWILNTIKYGTTKDTARPLYFSMDILATGSEFGNMGISGGMYYETKDRVGGAAILGLLTTSDKTAVSLDVHNNETNTIGTTPTGATIDYKEWHNIAFQFVPGSQTFDVYLDGVKYEGKLIDKYAGINNMYIDFSGSAIIDNFKFGVGYLDAPAQRGTVDLAFAGNDDAWSRGFAWDAENKCITSDKKAGLTIPYNDVVANFTNGTLLAADGTVAVADGQVDQIAITDANGYIHYFKIKPRTGTKFEAIGEGSYVLDVADGSNYGVADVNMFIVEYDGDTISNVIVVNPSDANIIGDTLYFDDVVIPEGASMFIFDNDSLRPLK